MKYWQFVNWEPAPIESALKSRVAVAIAAYESGDKNAIKEYYRQSATIETLQNPVVKIGGWAFSLREFCRVYWVQSRYYGIMELYALKQYMSETGVDSLTGTEHKVSYKAVVSSRIDTTALKKDAPEIAAKYTRTTESRRFTFA